MKENEIDHSLVARYVAGELHDEELEYFEKQLLSRQEYVHAVWEATVLLRGRSIDRLFDTDKGLERLNVSIQQTPTEKGHSKSASPIWHRTIKFAAVLIITLMGVWLFITLNNPVQKPKPSVAIVSYSTSDERKRIVLPDSSLVQLNYNSQISFRSVQFSKDRILHLEGEAYFEVKPSKSYPFRVQTTSGVISVLGTRFKVVSSPHTPFVTEVFQGKVEVKPYGDSDQTFSLMAGQAIKWETVGRFSFYNTGLDAPEWVSGVLHFEQAPLSEVFLKLEAYYGVKVTVKAPELLEKRINGTYKQVPLEIVLNQISKVYPFQYDLEKEYLIINPIQK